MSNKFAASWAQMLGLTPKARGSKAEDDSVDKDDKDAKGSRAEGDENDDDKGDKGAKGSRTEGDDNDGDSDARGSRADDEGDDDAAEDDDGDGDEGKDKAAKAAAKAERARCARIISAGVKLGRVEQAGVFAFDTGMSSRAAVAALNAAGAVSPAVSPKASGTASLRERMSNEPQPRRVEGKQGATSGSAADRIIAAGKKRRGEQ